MIKIPVTYYHTYPYEEIKWCKEQFGQVGIRWYYDARIFYFYYEEDAIMFVLGWS